jgi:hypothetical protein
MNQIAFPVQESVHCIGDVSADLIHPKSIGGGCYAHDFHFPTSQIQEEQDQEALLASASPITYSVTVDTSSISGTGGSLDFNLNRVRW